MFWHVCVKCQTFRDIPTKNGDTLAESYEGTIFRLEQMTRDGYQIKVQWELEIDNASIVKQKHELRTHPIVRQSPLRTRDALYGGRNETMRLHYKNYSIFSCHEPEPVHMQVV